jgi:hypothetical protein
MKSKKIYIIIIFCVLSIILFVILYKYIKKNKKEQYKLSNTSTDSDIRKVQADSLTTESVGCCCEAKKKFRITVPDSIGGDLLETLYKGITTNEDANTILKNCANQIGLGLVEGALVYAGFGFLSQAIGGLFGPQQQQPQNIDYDKIQNIITNAITDESSKNFIITNVNNFQSIETNIQNFINNYMSEKYTKTQSNCINTINNYNDNISRCMKYPKFLNPNVIFDPNIVLDEQGLSKRNILYNFITSSYSALNSFVHPSGNSNGLDNLFSIVMNQTNSCSTPVQLAVKLYPMINLSIMYIILYYQELALIDTFQIGNNYINPWLSDNIGDPNYIGQKQIPNSLLGELQKICQNYFNYILFMYNNFLSGTYNGDGQKCFTSDWLKMVSGTTDLPNFSYFLNYPYSNTLLDLKKIAGIKLLIGEAGFSENFTGISDFNIYSQNTNTDIIYSNEGGYPFGLDKPSYLDSINAYKMSSKYNNIDWVSKFNLYPSPILKTNFNINSFCPDLSVSQRSFDATMFNSPFDSNKYTSQMSCEDIYSTSYITSSIPGVSPNLKPNRVGYCINENTNTYSNIQNIQTNNITCLSNIVLSFDLTNLMNYVTNLNYIEPPNEQTNTNLTFNYTGILQSFRCNLSTSLKNSKTDKGYAYFNNFGNDDEDNYIYCIDSNAVFSFKYIKNTDINITKGDKLILNTDINSSLPPAISPTINSINSVQYVILSNNNNNNNNNITNVILNTYGFDKNNLNPSLNTVSLDQTSSQILQITQLNYYFLNGLKLKLSFTFLKPVNITNFDAVFNVYNNYIQLIYISCLFVNTKQNIVYNIEGSPNSYLNTFKNDYILDIKCPFISNKRQPEPEVYIVYNGIGYGLSDLTTIPSLYNAVLATPEQVQKAGELGAQWCIMGYTSKSTESDIQIYYPMQVNYPNVCAPPPGGTLEGTFKNLINAGNKVGINVFGIKPDKNSELAKNVSPFYKKMGPNDENADKWSQYD